MLRDLLLSDTDPVRIVYGTVSALGPPVTVTVPPSTVAVPCSVLGDTLVGVGVKVMLLQQGADRVILGPTMSQLNGGFVTNAAGNGATAGAGHTTIATVTIPSMPTSGYYMATGTLLCSAGDGASDFDAAIVDQVFGQLGNWRAKNAVNTNYKATASGTTDVGSSKTVIMELERIGGASTFGTVTDYRFARLDVIWLPR